MRISTYAKRHSRNSEMIKTGSAIIYTHFARAFHVLHAARDGGAVTIQSFVRRSYLIFIYYVYALYTIPILKCVLKRILF